MGPCRLSLRAEKEVCVELVRREWLGLLGDAESGDGMVVADWDLGRRCAARYGDEDVSGCHFEGASWEFDVK